MANILVLGGTGFVGRSVCEKLVERSGGADGRITVPSRRPARAGHIRMLPTVDLVDADLHDPSQLAHLVAGQDAVINLVAILHGSEAQFKQVHVDLPTRLAAACRSAGVPHLVHVSALGAASSAPSMYLRSKAAGEEALRASGQGLTVLRPSVIFGEHDSFLNLFAHLQALFPVMPLAGADARFQPVWVEDIAAAIVASQGNAAAVGQTFECAGPTVYTLRELVQLAGRWSAHVRPVLPLPDMLGRLQARVMELLPGTPLMSRDNVDSMRVPNVLGGKMPGLESLGIAPASLESVMRPLFQHKQGASRFEPWRMTAGRG